MRVAASDNGRAEKAQQSDHNDRATHTHTDTERGDSMVAGDNRAEQTETFSLCLSRSAGGVCSALGLRNVMACMMNE